MAPHSYVPLNVAVSVGCLFALALACGKSEETGAKPANSPTGLRETAIQHEACDGKTDAEDANGDGKPDIRHVFGAGGRELCRVSDLDFDGKPDQTTYYDASGQVRRREIDFDGNGLVNAIEHYANGQLVLKELDVSNTGRIDTWDVFDAAGKRVRRERDRNGDGKVDQWWTWEGDKVTILVDTNDDGQPDPDSAMVWGPNGLISAASAEASARAPSVPSLSTAVPAASTAASGPSTPASGSSSSSGSGGVGDAGADASPRRNKR